MRKIITLFISLFIVFTSWGQYIEHVYTFNDLEIGDLNGQDNWVSVANSVNKGDFDVNMAGSCGVAPDATQAIFFNFGGPNVGRTASRVSTPNFPFNFSIGGIVEIEAQIRTAWWGTHFAVGYDKNNNGYLMKGIEQVVNYEANEGGPGIHIAERPSIPDVFMMPNGTKVPFNYDDVGGWNTFKMFIDFEANAGQGSVSLFAKKPGQDYVAIAEVQNLNLGLTPGTGTCTDPATWTKFFVHATGGSPAFDNLVIRQPNTGGLQFQYITFDDISTHLTIDPPFQVHAVSSKNLPITFSVISGPATVSGNIVTLTGEAGIVKLAADQAGNDTVAAAQQVIRTFEVVNPYTVIPQIEIRNPLQDSLVYSPNLVGIPISIATDIEYPELLEVSQVNVEINGQILPAGKASHGFFFLYWTPPASGPYTMTAKAKSNHGVEISKSLQFTVSSSAPAMSRNIINKLHFATVNGKLDTTLQLPSFGGAYKKVMLSLTYECPPEGCEAWDLTSNVNIRGANGNWIELVRYITPYGKACNDQIDVTDYVSQIQGKVDLKANFPNKSVVTITLTYEPGEPDFKYSWLELLWLDTYFFGDMSNLQPVPSRIIKPDINAQEAHLRLVCTGHAGPNNSQNAAEFFETTHFVKINGSIKYSQHLWQTCNPNPVSCQPQSGTWYYNRAGWCPGTIPMTFKYDLNTYLSLPEFNLQYVFDTVYKDYCHPQNPDCVPSSSCNCVDTYNPNIIVSGQLITRGNNTVGPTVGVTNGNKTTCGINISPNPSNGEFILSYKQPTKAKTALVSIVNLAGNEIVKFYWDGNTRNVNLKTLTPGMYILKAINQDGLNVQKIVIR